MKRLLMLIFTLSQIWGQSINASLTIYKDGFGLVKQPVSWDVNVGNNTIKYDRITNGMYADSPFLDLQNVEVYTQRLNQNIFSSNKLFQEKLGEQIVLKVSGEKSISGTLLEYNSSQISIQTKSNIQSFFRNKIDYIAIKKDDLIPQFRPVLSWDIIAKNSGTARGNLVYMSGGFDWNAKYRMIMLDESNKAILIPEAFVKNNSDLSFSRLSLQLVEGNLNRVRHDYAVKSLQRSNAMMEYAEADMGYSGATPERENLGDYYIYTISNELKLNANESIIVRLYDAREISYQKTYLFENYEQTQSEEPLAVEIKIDNTEKNNLNLPLPQGTIELYQTKRNGQLEFLGEDMVKQVPKGATARLIAGRAFDVVGKRKVLNYDRQRKSEEASIEITVTNTKNHDANVKIIEKISGDWVIRDESTRYIKEDASTIYFPITVPANSEMLVTYTYRKEWK
ncbi:MAG: hypothetical protein GWP19_12445 [Planctomycetia bacterium]|nr:hypothetical protein [Planctomycetia bacterium]